MESNPTVSLVTLRIWMIASIHLGVGICIVFISSFVNSEMKLLDWRTSLIPLYLGGPIAFELIRLLAGYIYDKFQVYKPQLVFGSSVSIIGIITIQSTVEIINSPLIFVSVSTFYLGSAILTTLADTNLTSDVINSSRANIAGAIQLSRLFGFAIGGIMGSILYSRLSFSNLVFLVSILYFLFCLFLLIFSFPVQESYEVPDTQSGLALLEVIKSPTPFSMTVFMIIYPLGLFMQDLILEPFAIDQFNFERDKVGIVVAVWTTLTLVFVPVGVYLERIGKSRSAILYGSIIAVLGLIGFTFTTIKPSLPLFFISLVLFGIGNGTASTPSISLMLGVSRSYPTLVGMLLAYFGILNTLGRLLANMLASVILAKGDYFSVFVVETVFAVIAIFPILYVHHNMKGKQVQFDPSTLTSSEFVSYD